MILTLGIECFRFTPSTVLTNAHLLPVSQTLSSAPSLPTGPPDLQTDASRKHCHQRHHGESPICDFCCQLGLSNLWVLSEHGSPRALFFFSLVVFHFFSCILSSTQRVLSKNECSERRINASSKDMSNVLSIPLTT